MQGFTLTFPINIGPKSSQIKLTTSKGIGGDRTMKRILDESNEILKQGFLMMIETKTNASFIKQAKKRTKKAELESTLEWCEWDMYKADAVWARTLALNQTFKQIAPEQHVKINPIAKHAADLDCHMTNPSLPPNDDAFFHAKIKSNQATKTLNANAPLLVGLDCTNDEVKR